MIADLARIAVSAVPSLIASGARTLVVAGLAAAALMCVRRASATLRLSVWTSVLGVALAMPVLDRVVPRVAVPVPGLDAVLARMSQSTQLSAERRSDTEVTVPEAVGPSRADGAQRGVLSAVVNRVRRLDWRVIAGSLYLVGALALLLRAATGWIVSRRLVRRARPILDAHLLARLQVASASAGLTTPPRLAEADGLLVPIAASIVRPVVILPADWPTWPAATLDAVFVHELAHIARRDALTQRLSLFYRAAAWPNPFSWWLHHHLAELAETASDEAVLESGADGPSYAEVLVGFFTMIRDEPRRAAWDSAMARETGTNAARRIDWILAWRADNRRLPASAWRIVLALVTMPAILFAVSADPSARPYQGVAGPMAGSRPMAAAFSNRVVPSQPVEASRLAGGTAHARAQAAPVQPPPSSAPKQPAVAPAPPREGPSGVQAVSDDDEVFRNAYPSDAAGLVGPLPILQQEASYTAQALRAKIHGSVTIEAVVLPDGTVGPVRIAKSLDDLFGLDEMAVKAAKRWTFAPGTVSGKPVPVIVELVLEFRLH